jgi:acid phosphatase type 7
VCRWDSYGRLAEPAASRIPWMTAAGNHEIELEGPRSTARAFVAYEARYAPTKSFYSESM